MGPRNHLTIIIVYHYFEGLRKEFGILVPVVTVITEYKEQILTYDLSTAYQISASPHIRDHYEVKLTQNYRHSGAL